jgi:hypothetical protein
VDSDETNRTIIKSGLECQKGIQRVETRDKIAKGKEGMQKKLSGNKFLGTGVNALH